jgi:hypothetical protein
MNLGTELAYYPVNRHTHNSALSSRPSFTYTTQLGTDCPHFEACELALLDICLYGKCFVLLNMNLRNAGALSLMLPRIFGATRLPRYWSYFPEWLQTLCEVVVTTVLLVPAVKMRGKSQANTRFEVLTAVLPMMVVFWDVTPCCWVICDVSNDRTTRHFPAKRR